MSTYSYPGRELEIFRHATRWKAYYSGLLRPLIRGDVLEVGAGLGGTSPFLCDGSQRSWTCLEPDPGLYDQLAAILRAQPLACPVRTFPGSAASLPGDEGKAVVFAERTRRSESWTFRLFYALYRWAHLVLTGIPVRVGNFSIIPASQLRRLVVVSELWNHYAAAVFKSRVPRASIPTIRGERLDGKGQMNFVGLVTHGLSAFSVHSAVLGVRLLVVTATLIVLMSFGLVLVVAIRIFTSLAIPGWTSTVAGILLILLVQAVAFASFFAFLVLHARSQPTFIPLRDYEYFVDSFSSLVAPKSTEPPPECDAA